MLLPEDVTALKNKKAFIKVFGLEIPVNVTDRRTMIGRTEYLVTPVGGTGKLWKIASNVILRDA